MIIDFTALIGLLILSGFFSSTEVAFIISNKFKIQVKARKNMFFAKQALYFVNNPNELFTTILIGNNFVNIAFATIISIYLTDFFALDELSILLISSVLLLLFGEILPKFLAREIPETVLFSFSIPIRLLSFIFFPFIKLFNFLTNVIIKNNKSISGVSHFFLREDIQNLIEEGEKMGSVDKSESEILKGIIDFNEMKVHEVMTPRTEIIGIEINSNIEELITVFIDSGYSKIPVFEENIDNIKGLVLSYDLFTNPSNINQILRSVIYVPDTKKCPDLLNEFLAKRSSFAVVIDEFGGTAGIVTMEDIIEQMFGDIKDEYDTDDEICRKINDTMFLLSGKIHIDFLNETYDLEIPEGDYETIAGYLTSKLDRFPKQGEILEIDNFKFQILRATEKTITLIKLFIA